MQIKIGLGEGGGGAGSGGEYVRGPRESLGELDDDGGGGMIMTAQGRAQLMQKLQRGQNLGLGQESSGFIGKVCLLCPCVCLSLSLS